MPRKKLADPPVEIHISLPSSIVARLEILLADPLTGKPRYGARARLINRLVNDWIELKQKEKVK